jgi:putative restriction endonuclease
VRGYVANTDYDWWEYLASQPDLDEVNFWFPKYVGGFQAIAPGEPIFFKLKRPHYAIAGFGVFVRHAVLPAWLAWDSFGRGNGAPTFEEMCRRIGKYRDRDEPESATASYRIGCLIVGQPVFFDRPAWIPQPSDWGAQTVRGVGYDLTVGEGRRIYEACLGHLRAPAVDAWAERAADRYGAPELVRPRLGQGSFRIAVTDAYGRACAVTTEHSLPTLEAAHIKPYARGGEHAVANGLLLRRDIHRLFDLGYVTVGADDQRFEVSRRLKDEWENGRVYYQMRGQRIVLPSRVEDHPRRELLEWHNRQMFLG